MDGKIGVDQIDASGGRAGDPGGLSGGHQQREPLRGPGAPRRVRCVTCHSDGCGASRFWGGEFMGIFWVVGVPTQGTQ